MKDLKIVQSCPDDDYYLWQTHLWLESLKEKGLSHKAISLIFTPDYREPNPKWKKVEELYPEAEFFHLKDEDKVSKLLGIYIPILRPYMLMKYWLLHPEMQDKAIFYCDADVVFLENFDLEPFLHDDICYLSNTNSYINASYFDSKVKDVLPEKLEEYKTRDILEECCKLVGVSRKTAMFYNEHSGGAQYLLKNIDVKFWEKMLGDCIKIKTHLSSVNKTYFENESRGFQSWCSDMFSLLWNLWNKGLETKVVKELDFSWSSDPISRIETTTILHNAGIVAQTQGDIPVFYKGVYHQGKDPFKEPHIYDVYENEKSKTLANWYYVKKLIELKSKYNLNY